MDKGVIIILGLQFIDFFLKKRIERFNINLLNHKTINFKKMTKICNLSSCWQKKAVYKIKNNIEIKSIEIIDMKRLRRYRPDCFESTALKAVLVFMFNPIIMVLKMVFNFIQIAFDYVKVTVDSGLDTMTAIKNKNIIKLFEIFVISRIDFFKYLIEDVIAIVKAPFFAISIQLSSIYMFFDPSNGVKLINSLERGWNNNKGIKSDYRYSKEAQSKPFYKFLWDMLLKRDESVVFYLAPCFQSVGSLKDKHIRYYSDV